jgi:DNA-binding NtrC family response regulator
MMIYLTAVSGPHKGRVWPLDDRGLLVGRDTDCSIIANDSMVSRRHCRLVLDSNTARLEDLGSRNPALVNGRPTTHAVLSPGDEIAIGRSLFLVASLDEGAQGGPAEGATGETVPWDRTAPVFLSPDSAVPDLQPRPHTVMDLAFLYDVARELSALSHVADVLEALCLRVMQRFNPKRLWGAFVHGHKDLALWDLPQSALAAPSTLAPPVDVMRCVLEEGRGGLFPASRCESGRTIHSITAAAPLMVATAPIGVMAIQTERPHGAYDEEDLKLLVLLAKSVAPILHSASLMEQLECDNERLRAISGEGQTLLGDSRAMQHIRTQITKAARSNLNVLVTGETGTGKELAARMVHARSAVRAEPFVVVNCAAIPRDLFESELFGYEKGAFTGASQMSPGLFVQAHGGTLFLDEIGDLSLDNQAKILRAVEWGTFRRVGGGEELSVTVRIIAATNKDLQQAMRQNLFREDLYHRLNGFELFIPPLREHASDIPILVEHFLQLAAEQAKHPVTGISADALQHLKSRAWSGNVRELRNCVLRAALTSRRETLRLDDFPDLPQVYSEAPSPGSESPLSLAEMEKIHIKAVIGQCGGNMKAAAQVLQIARSTLYAKIAEHNIR